VDNASVFERAKQLDLHVNGILSRIDVDALMPDERSFVALIKRQLTDGRLDVRDYEYAETRAEQLKYAKAARDSFTAIQKHILQASEHNMFSAIDVAHISAHIQQIIAELQ
jgi:hypothetical protein